MTWLAHAGPDASSGEAVGSGAVVLAGPGVAPAPSRINGVLTAVRGMVVHAVVAGQAPAGLVSLLYEVADDRDLPEAARARRVGWRGGCGRGIGCVSRKRPWIGPVTVRSLPCCGRAARRVTG
jgi:hypothetical protein